ncbi:GpE family phage tail protein [Escherichia coli]|nr:GpE family phage tail protein [Escherichia coli]
MGTGEHGRAVTCLCFDCIEDPVADIAVIFNWPPAEIFAMTPAEVVAWRERAAARSGSHNHDE